MGTCPLAPDGWCDDRDCLGGCKRHATVADALAQEILDETVKQLPPSDLLACPRCYAREGWDAWTMRCAGCGFQDDLTKIPDAIKASYRALAADHVDTEPGFFLARLVGGPASETELFVVSLLGRPPREMRIPYFLPGAPPDTLVYHLRGLLQDGTAIYR